MARHLSMVALVLGVLGVPMLRPDEGRASFPGRNGALLIAAATSRSTLGCEPAGPPFAGARAADPDPCFDGTDPPRPQAVWLWGPGRGRPRVVASGFDQGAFSRYGRVLVLRRERDQRLFLAPPFPGAPLTRLPWSGQDPAWTALGRVSFSDEEEVLYSAPSSGSGRRREVGGGTGARWSVRGRWAATGLLLTAGERVVSRLFVSDAAGRDVAFVHPAAHGDFDWSPDGRHLVVVRTRGSFDEALWIVRADGRRVRRLTTYTSDLTSPRWSPDGTRIAVLHGRDVVVVSARAHRVQGPSRWRTVLRRVATLLDWQPLP